MTRQQKLQEIGNINVKEYTSKFIIPTPHNFYKNDKSVFQKLEDIGWKIHNKDINDRKLASYNIKAYIYDNMVPSLNDNESEFIDSFNSLFLTKEINKEVELTDGKDTPTNYNFNLKSVDLWIFEEHIAFFVLNIDLDYTKYTIDQLSYFHTLLRGFKFLQLDTSDKMKLTQTPVFKGERFDVLEYLISLTNVKGNQSFLKITNDVCKDLFNPLYPIYNTSINAKLLTAMQTEKATYSDGSAIEEFYTEDLQILDVKSEDILTEVPFYLASCIPLSSTPDSLIPNNGYLFDNLKQGGFNIWKYSSGVTLHDSCVIFGLENKGGPVVDNTNDQFYFIYMLNLYINFQIRYLESTLINKDFESLDIGYWYKKLQKLKNQFLTKEIAIKFQENEFHKSVTKALKTDEMIEEVTHNLVETKNITKDDVGIYITLIGFIFVSIFQDPIKNFFNEYAFFTLAFAIPIGIIAFIKRRKLKKIFKL
jgi:hypothetical protein